MRKRKNSPKQLAVWLSGQKGLLHEPVALDWVLRTHIKKGRREPLHGAVLCLCVHTVTQPPQHTGVCNNSNRNRMFKTNLQGLEMVQQLTAHTVT